MFDLLNLMNPSSLILCQKVEESPSFHVHISIFVLFLYRFFYEHTQTNNLKMIYFLTYKILTVQARVDVGNKNKVVLYTQQILGTGA